MDCGYARSTGWIKCREVANPLGIIGYELEWEGGDIARINRHLLRAMGLPDDPPVGTRFNLGPYRVVVLPSSWVYSAVTLLRDHRWAWLWLLWYRILTWIDRAYRKVILTLAVWGLAKYDPAKIPTWDDVYVLRSLAQRIHAFTERVKVGLRRLPDQLRGESQTIGASIAKRPVPLRGAGKPPGPPPPPPPNPRRELGRKP